MTRIAHVCLWFVFTCVCDLFHLDPLVLLFFLANETCSASAMDPSINKKSRTSTESVVLCRCAPIILPVVTVLMVDTNKEISATARTKKIINECGGGSESRAFEVTVTSIQQASLRTGRTSLRKRVRSASTKALAGWLVVSPSHTNQGDRSGTCNKYDDRQIHEPGYYLRLGILLSPVLVGGRTFLCNFRFYELHRNRTITTLC